MALFVPFLHCHCTIKPLLAPLNHYWHHLFEFAPLCRKSIIATLYVVINFRVLYQGTKTASNSRVKSGTSLPTN